MNQPIDIRHKAAIDTLGDLIESFRDLAEYPRVSDRDAKLLHAQARQLDGIRTRVVESPDELDVALAFIDAGRLVLARAHATVARSKLGRLRE